MPIPSEFEEKEFEAPLYNQLETGTRLVWSPGQVFEEYIGIDRAIFLRDPSLWRFFGRSSPLPGTLLGRYDWDFIWRRRARRSMPSFRLNLFIQAKRCFYYSRRPRRLARYMPLKKCWKFEVTSEQHAALARVATRVENQAMVVYAAPAFHRISELNAHTVRGSILAHCSFPLVNALNNHSAWYYASPGGSGVANIEPTPIEGMGLQERLEKFISSTPSLSEGTSSAQLEALSKKIREAISEEISDENGRKGMFFESLRQIDYLADDFEDAPRALRHFLQIRAFATAFNLEWYVVSKE